jgi:hypothetical protein
MYKSRAVDRLASVGRGAVAEPVSHSRLGDQISRARRVGLELGADVGDVDS